MFSPDGATIAATNLDGTVTLWDAESATVRETLRGHSGSVQQAAFSPDGETLYTASHDGTAIAWDLAGPRRRAPVQVHGDLARTTRTTPIRAGSARTAS